MTIAVLVFLFFVVITWLEIRRGELIAAGFTILAMIVALAAVFIKGQL